MEKETKIVELTEYHRLIRRDCELQALEAAGVDNWQGYGEHTEFYKELLDGYGLKDE